MFQIHIVCDALYKAANVFGPFGSQNEAEQWYGDLIRTVLTGKDWFHKPHPTRRCSYIPGGLVFGRFQHKGSGRWFSAHLVQLEDVPAPSVHNAGDDLDGVLRAMARLVKPPTES